MTLQAHVREARVRLEAAGIAGPEARLDADLLARHVLGWDRATLIARMPEAAPPGFDAAFGALVARRVRREPVAYIRGTQEFWGREFLVRSGVLIPRPETEFIVEEALAWVRTSTCPAPVRVLDIGTGSGCLAITLALELGDGRVSATDVSTEALDVARENARRLGAAIDLHAGEFVASAPGPFDLVVSNPPYVTAGDHGRLQPEVRDYEPATALVGGHDGLDVVRKLAGAAAGVLAPGGLLLIEIGQGQAASAERILANTEGLRLLRVREDLQGIPRVVVARHPAAPSTSSG